MNRKQAMKKHVIPAVNTAITAVDWDAYRKASPKEQQRIREKAKRQAARIIEESIFGPIG